MGCNGTVNQVSNQHSLERGQRKEGEEVTFKLRPGWLEDFSPSQREEKKGNSF